MQQKDEQKRQHLPVSAWLERVTDSFDSATHDPKTHRRIVQICASKHGVYALASDGTIWLGSPVSETWHQLPNLPQE